MDDPRNPRFGADGRVEVAIAHPLGVAEIAEGSLAGGVIDVTATALTRTSTGSDVTGLRRRIEVVDDVLRYELAMAMRNEVPTRHLAGELKRVSAP